MKVVALSDAEKIEIRKRMSAIKEAEDMRVKINAQSNEALKDWNRYTSILCQSHGFDSETVIVSECGNYLLVSESFIKSVLPK